MRSFFFLVILCGAFDGLGQFNDSVNYFVKLASTGIINRTNERDSYVLNNALRFSVYKKIISLNSNSGWIYGEQQQQLSNNDFVTSLDFDLYKTKRHIYYWGLLHYEKSYSLKIDDRFQGGLGIGYYAIDRENFVLQISDGILYESSDLTGEGAPGLEYETYRNSLRLKFRFIHLDRVTLEGVNFIQHSLSDKHDYIVRSSTNLSFRVWKFISFTIAVNYNKLALTNRENFLLNYGIALERYF